MGHFCWFVFLEKLFHLDEEFDCLIGFRDPNILANGKNVASFEPPPNTSKEASSWSSLLGVDTSTCLPHHLPMWRWQEFDERTEAFLILDTERMTTGHHPRSRQCLFWRRWFPIMLQQGNTTVFVVEVFR